MPYDLPDAGQPCPVCTSWTGDERFHVAVNEHAIAVVSPRQRVADAAVIFPRVHVTTPTELTAEQMAAMWRLAQLVTVAIEQVCDPDGMHTWEDIGVDADASFAHLTLDIVPRHNGDEYRYAPYAKLPETPADARLAQVQRLRAALD